MYYNKPTEITAYLYIAVPCLLCTLIVLPISPLPINNITPVPRIKFPPFLSPGSAGPPASWINMGWGGSGRPGLPGVWRNVTTERSRGRRGLDLLDHSVIRRPLKVRSEADLGTMYTHTDVSALRLGGSEHIPLVQLGDKGRTQSPIYPRLEDLTGAFWRSP